jgi:two-component system CheB/CheR fusion protein
MRLIALTGYGQASDRRATTDAGFEAHLVKPVDFVELERLLA